MRAATAIQISVAQVIRLTGSSAASTVLSTRAPIPQRATGAKAPMSRRPSRTYSVTIGPDGASPSRAPGSRMVPRLPTPPRAEEAMSRARPSVSATSVSALPSEAT